MNFYYDPILGLNYIYLDPNVEINLAAIPESIDMDKLLYYAKQQGVMMFNSKVEEESYKIFHKITNYFIP